MSFRDPPWWLLSSFVSGMMTIVTGTKNLIIQYMPMWQNWGKFQVKLEFSLQNWGKLQVKLKFYHVGVYQI